LIWCTLLNPALDILYEVDDFINGKIYVNCPQQQIPAGKGLNVSRIIGQLGEEVCLTGLLPEYSEKQVTSFCEIHAISHHFYTIPGAIRLNTTINDKKNALSTHFSSVASTVSSRIQHEYTRFIEPKMQTGDYWCLSGSLPKGIHDNYYGTLISLCNEKGGRTLLDTRAAALQHGVRSKPLIIKPNLNELEEFFDEPIKGVHHIALKGKRLLDMGVSYIFISLGEDGMIALHKNDCLLCSPPHVEVRDTVGCGDAVVAGVTVALKRQFSFNETCRMAVACGTAKAMLSGPGSIMNNAVWQLMEEVSITSV
jgi:1-phosphofructokinase family hexose kinase